MAALRAPRYLLLMLFLVRFAETGRESQVKHRATRRDLVAAVRSALPDADVRADTGRLLVATAAPDAASALGRVHGIRSFSACQSCSLTELDSRIGDFVADALARASTFRVKVKRSGEHGFTSAELAARLGARLLDRFDHLRVDMRTADVVVGVEVRDGDCYVFDHKLPGADHRPRAMAALAATGAPRFLVDQMLGPLTGWLRLLGFDTTYARDIPDCNVVRIAVRESRIIITRDLELSETPAVHAVYLTRKDPAEQLEELAETLRLRIDGEAMFSRCSICNGMVDWVDKQQFADQLPDEVFETYDEMTRCEPCDKLYWKGGQYQRIHEQLARFID